MSDLHITLVKRFATSEILVTSKLIWSKSHPYRWPGKMCTSVHLNLFLFCSVFALKHISDSVFLACLSLGIENRLTFLIKETTNVVIGLISNTLFTYTIYSR